MSATDTKAAPTSVNLAELERTLQASIKLMRRGRREMERLRRKPGKHEQGGHGQVAS